MKVVVARTAGFCKGVKNALEMALEAIQRRQEGETITTFGPLIHNRQVLAMLEEKDVREENDIERCAGKKIIIRAHGIPPQERQVLHRLNATLLDATCKRVAKVHAIIKRHARRGFHTVILGDADHAEVIGLMGYAEGRGRVIHRPEQIEELPETWSKVLLVAQTTQNEEIFEEIQRRFLKRYPEGVVKNTICGSTHERQAEVRQMCAQVDAVVVVGGFHSGNTLRLAEIARECSAPTYHIETEADLNRQEMARYSSVGITAGASTPNWIIQNVVDFLESIRPERSRLRLRRALNLLAYSNIAVAISAALLTVAAQALLGWPGSAANSAMAALYVFAMHSLNIFLDRNAIQLNDPGRADFYQHWRQVFTGTSLVAVVASLWAALGIGFLTFIAMAVLILLGVLYAVPLILPALWPNLSTLKIKDIPTSKTFFVPIAWASVIALLPNLNHLWADFGRVAWGFLIVFLLVLIRTALLDLLAVHGDRLVGKETLVVLVGEAKTRHFIIGMLALLGAALFLGPLLGLSAWFAWFMLPAVAVYAWCLRLWFQNRLKEDPLYEILIEGVLTAVGVMGLLWMGVS